MKIEVNELIESVKDELLCYENNEKVAEEWVKEFKVWMDDSKQVKRGLLAIKGKRYLSVKEEDEIFEIADSYMDAIEENNKAKYWKEF